LDDDYLAEMWKPIIRGIEKISKKKYGQNKREMRIIADHIKAAVFIIADGILPSNTEQGYVLRRLIRRIVRYGKFLMMQSNFTKQLAGIVMGIYDDYDELQKNKEKIMEELEKEENRFRQTLASGLKYFNKITKNKKISGKEAFLLYQSYGFPPEIIKEECEKIKVKYPEKGFEKELKKHQELSRTATEGRFKSGLADDSEATTRLHTATHLLLQALKIVLKDSSIRQSGSNITPERLRFDFSFPRKLEKKEIKDVEDLVNAQIQKSCEVVREEMSPEEAKKRGACGIFERKYGEKVSVYTIGNFSKEICAGPHVKNTCEMGRFRILKEESSSAGIRRIKATLS
jgi:alanyl-tRNA synthetase